MKIEVGFLVQGGSVTVRLHILSYFIFSEFGDILNLSYLWLILDERDSKHHNLQVKLLVQGINRKDYTTIYFYIS